MAGADRDRILSLLEAGRISADQAAALLEALRESDAPTGSRPGRPGRPPTPPGPPKPRPPAQLLRIRIDASDDAARDDKGNARIHVNVPLKLARFAARFLPKEARLELERQKIDLVELIESLGDEVPDGPLVDIDTQEDGSSKRARIRIEVA
ncbi:MAG: hypothetical protein WD336_11220 [Trueperaceae bacterium]